MAELPELHIVPRNPSGTQGWSAPFRCPRCKKPAELWWESFKGGNTYLHVRHTGENVERLICQVDVTPTAEQIRDEVTRHPR